MLESNPAWRPSYLDGPSFIELCPWAFGPPISHAYENNDSFLRVFCLSHKTDGLWTSPSEILFK